MSAIEDMDEDEIRVVPDETSQLLPKSRSFNNAHNSPKYGSYEIANPSSSNDLTRSQSPRPGTSLVLCVHGNKFGLARCCDDLGHDEGQAMDRGRSPILLPISDKPEGVIPNSQSSSDIHCHTSRNEGVDVKARRKLIIACILCVIFMIMEAVGGILANSLAIATDAAHLLTDFASFLISLFSLWVATRPATQKMSFGWHRAEVIGATCSVLMIWVVTGILLYLAIMRMVHHDYEIQAEIMLITSGIGVLVNIVMGCTLHQHGHSHGGGGHGHSHSSNSDTNLNVRAAYIHVIGDFIQSLGVFIAAILIYFRPEWGIADPICTILFSVLVLYTTLKILRDTVVVLMEGIPKGVSYSVVQELLLSIDGIVGVHNLRIWGLTTDKNAIIAHLAIQPGTNAQEVLKMASCKLRESYNFYEMTLQVEDFQEEMDSCNQCKNPS